MPESAPLPPEIASALADSCLADLPSVVLDRVLVGAEVVRHPRGTVVRSPDDPRATQAPGLVIEGLLRVFRHEADGREATARYVDAGDLIGLAALLGFADNALAPGLGASAVHDTIVLEFSPEAFSFALRDEAALGLAVCRYVFGELLATQHALTGSVLLPVRSRVASHLLDLAERCDRYLIVTTSPQQLAAAAGSVREVVSRVLRQLEETGIVRRERDRVVLLDSAALHRLASNEMYLRD